MKNKSKSINKTNKKHICILSDCFIPTRNSASGMIYNLSKYLLDEGYSITCIHAGYNPKNKPEIFKNYNIKDINFITSELFIKLRNKNNFMRFFFELSMSINLSLKSLRYFKYFKNNDLLIWYGPSAFFWLPALVIKLISGCPLYYIVRDVFPDWLYSTGLIKNKFLFLILRILTNPQYSLPNKIGVESPGNIKLIKNYVVDEDKIEVLYNWPSLNINSNLNCKDVNYKIKKNKNIKGIYSGNFGIAQDSKNLLNFLLKIKNKLTLKVDFFTKNLVEQKEITFRNPVSENELMFLFKKYQFGVLSLNTKLNTHNIPGKFVSYTQFGLPVLCFSNLNSTIANLIITNKCGIVIDIYSSFEKNCEIIKKFLKIIERNNNSYSKNSRKVYQKLFDIKNVKSKIENLIKHD